MSSGIEFGIAFDGFVPVRDAVVIAQRAEAVGGRSFWIAEHLGYREVFVTATAIALGTATGRIVPTAISPYLRHPVPMAMALASLAELAPGRIDVAAGVGNPMFLRESGLEPEKPLEAMRDYVEALRALATGDPVQKQGRTFRLAGARVSFKPDTSIPVHIAAMGPQMLRLTGRIADGVVLSSGLSAESVRRALALVDEGARAEQRDPALIGRASYIYFLAGGDAESRGRVREKLAFLFRNATIKDNLDASGLRIDHEAIMAAVARRDVKTAASLVTDEAVELFTITGDVATCRRRVREYRDAGLTEIVLSLVGTPEDRMRSLEHVPAILAP
ncbi:MAG: LLM class flavin-dependent oxidoreductase [Burkholderiales bacterium]